MHTNFISIKNVLGKKISIIFYGDFHKGSSVMIELSQGIFETKLGMQNKIILLLLTLQLSIST